MKFGFRLIRNENGVAAIETAFALPILILMIWMFVQFAQIYRALSGIQQALGEGARYATLCLNPSITGCGAPTAPQIKTKIEDNMAGVGQGSYNVPDPVSGSDGTGNYYDLTVTYTQPTSLLVLPGPTIHLSRSKRVWTAA
ncbi:MAG TPA: TadE/TadG family type IV pilus assembly protein [Sphingomicrobium sp.]|jgi:Flp pilus assembly protein TadG|nr:TadE/TadG family type IV pilus assembly protein [Sphingomicrobium sp.]